MKIQDVKFTKQTRKNQIKRLWIYHLRWVGFYIPLATLWVIAETMFPANLLIGAKQTKLDTITSKNNRKTQTTTQENF